MLLRVSPPRVSPLVPRDSLPLSFCLRCPPRTFIPALCRIFLDESAPENVLEVTARAVTYYLDVSAECTRRIVAVDGTVRSICNRLVSDGSSRTSRDLAEQCVKVSPLPVCLLPLVSASLRLRSSS